MKRPCGSLEPSGEPTVQVAKPGLSRRIDAIPATGRNVALSSAGTDGVSLHAGATAMPCQVIANARTIMCMVSNKSGGHIRHPHHRTHHARQELTATMSEIGATLKRTANTVGQMLFRIRRTLIECVSDESEVSDVLG
ncbi:hypothetical protein [Novipirellula artificiosorum]|uniref:hypothetical protein n=1 Tax=Novipirellula artificiosorum TaxID=2528016 RepID=UPI0011B64AA4|nr:hypothetical protein [Novipirellula artificiosorum]